MSTENQTIDKDSIFKDLIFKDQIEKEEFIKNKYSNNPQLAQNILNNCAHPAYISTQQELEFLINSCSFSKYDLHILKLDVALIKMYENANAAGSISTTHNANINCSHLMHYGSFVAGRLNSNIEIQNHDDYYNQIKLSKCYIVSKTQYISSNVSLNKLYRTNECLKSASEISFFNSKIDLGIEFKMISDSKELNTTPNTHVISTPWYYISKKKLLRRYTLEKNKVKNTFDMYEYNVFNKRTSSCFIGSFNEAISEFAIASMVNRVNIIRNSSYSEYASYEIYDFETMHKFCQITGFDINDIPDFLSNGLMYYYDNKQNQLILRDQYLKEKNIKEKKKNRQKRKEEIKQQLQKIKEEKNIDGKIEAIGFLESLLDY